jgi:hypothetical protein
MTKDEALKFALEALEAIDKLDLGLSEYATRELTTLDAFVKSTVTAIKEALAQPEMRPDEISTDELIYMNGLYDGKKQERALWELTKLGQEIEAQEPDAWREFDGEGGYYYRSYEHNEDYCSKWDANNPNHKGWVQPLYTTPPKRQWVGLTDDERFNAVREAAAGSAMRRDGSTSERIAIAIEAKLRSKNT